MAFATHVLISKPRAQRRETKGNELAGARSRIYQETYSSRAGIAPALRPHRQRLEQPGQR